jgi:hypothetical protein
MRIRVRRAVMGVGGSVAMALALNGLVSAGGALPGAAVPDGTPWSTIASVGVVDDAAQDIVDTSFNVVRSKGGLVTLRYPVTPVPGLFGGTGITMTISYADQDPVGSTVPFATVTATLKKTMFNGGHANVVAFSSDAYAPTGSNPPVHTRSRSACNVTFDFANATYYVEVTINRRHSNYHPSLHWIKIQSTNPICRS